MDLFNFHSPQNSDFSPESSFGSSDSFFYGQSFDVNSLPFNENDSEEMLLFGLIAEGTQESTSKASSFSSSSSFSSHIIKEEEVKESLKDMTYSREDDGCSPVVALKRKHSMGRKIMGRSRKERDVRIDNVVVFEDLGADYLEELLNSSGGAGPW
ncbi:Ethylene-responsive transcription factor 1B [Tripterygium wilfordii]|uniref:Ethylene-responsive transcription factor 1B n=1 Tax=Tripterygium wilfordii TaxID=458696 RepID=A0A7J7CRS5_TRIWF|nr:Ethylene-responsive transcription factor 1B [Tripterygium wilfordii]